MLQLSWSTRILESLPMLSTESHAAGYRIATTDTVLFAQGNKPAK